MKLRDINYQKLIKAVQANDIKGARRELGRTLPNTTGDCMAALHNATSAEMVELLCDMGADVNLQCSAASSAVDSYGPIHTAAQRGNVAVLRALVARSAKIDALTVMGGLSAMHLASTPEMVRALMECGGAALLNQCDYNGETPLDRACSSHTCERNTTNWPVFYALQELGAKSGYQLDKERQALVDAKKAEAAGGTGQGLQR